jgi:regulator of sigma E protease
MSPLLTVIAFFLVLGPLVFFHELGHFLFAKLARIRVIEFGFGYPPRAWKFWQSAGQITIAGVRITIPKNFKARLARADAERLFKKQAGDQSAGFGFLDRRLPMPGDVMDVMENGRFVEAAFGLQPDGSRVLHSIKLLDPSTENVESVPSTTFARGEVTDYVPGTEYTLNWLPVGGFTRMLGEEDPTASDSFAAAPKRWRFAVLAAGPAMNIVLAFFIFVIMFMSGAPEPKDVAVAINTVNPGSPADSAGLKPGDIILSVNGQLITGTTQVIQITRANLGRELALSIQRGQDRLDLRATPRRADEYDATKEGPLGISIGVQVLSFNLRYYSPLEAVPLGLNATVGSVAATVLAPVAILRGLIPAGEARPVGPVGIAQIAGAQAEASLRLRGLFPILQLAGFLSVAIGLTNLLPLPALDGGRLVFVIIEAIRRRRIDPKKETIVHLVGMALLLTLMLVITLQDILNPIVIPKTF